MPACSRVSASGEPLGGGPAGVGCAAQEAVEELEFLVVIVRADLVHRGVHPGVDEVEAEDLRAAAGRYPQDDTAAVGGVAVAVDPAAAFEPVQDAGQGGGVQSGPLGQGARAERARSEEHTSELQSQFHLVCRLL